MYWDFETAQTFCPLNQDSFPISMLTYVQYICAYLPYYYVSSVIFSHSDDFILSLFEYQIGQLMMVELFRASLTSFHKDPYYITLSIESLIAMM